MGRTALTTPRLRKSDGSAFWESMQRVCAACQQPITDEERWFRVRGDYVHLACSERYMRHVSERRREQKATPPPNAPDTDD